MTKKIGGVGGKKKIDRVESTGKAKGVEGTEGISSVSGIKATAGVSGVQSVGGLGSIRDGSRVMTAAEREKMLWLIKDEAEKMASQGILPASVRDTATQAVMMAIDAGIVVEEDPKEGETGKKK